MNRPEQISTLADFSFPEIETFLIVITRSTVAFFFAVHCRYKNSTSWKKVIAIWGITHTSKREP